jgi:glycine/D-amino acid oxidase-like deaminating enzyme
VSPLDEVDVLVAGFGPAGASAAIAAHDEGATVAVVEKTSSGGGNCVHSGGFLFEVEGPGAVEHLDALCFGKTDRAVLEAFSRGLPSVPEFVHELGGATAPVDLEAFGGMLPCWPHFPGGDRVRAHCRRERRAASDHDPRPLSGLTAKPRGPTRRRRTR